MKTEKLEFANFLQMANFKGYFKSVPRNRHTMINRYLCEINFRKPFIEPSMPHEKLTESVQIEHKNSAKLIFQWKSSPMQWLSEMRCYRCRLSVKMCHKLWNIFGWVNQKSRNEENWVSETRKRFQEFDINLLFTLHFPQTSKTCESKYQCHAAEHQITLKS